MTSQELLIFLRPFIMPCQLPAWNLEPPTCTSRQTTRSRTHYLWGGTPCKARLHSQVAARLQISINDNQQLLAELKATI